MIYLPLDKIISQQDASVNQKSASNTSQNTNVAAVPEQIPTVEMRFSKDGRSRDARDSRDREVR